MAQIDFNGIFDFIDSLIRRREPNITDRVPSVADLEDRVNQLRASKSSQGEVGEESPVQTITPGKASSIPTGCIPCSIGHLGTCSGLLNEAMRFARSDGVGSEEVISRVNMCLDELNALERVDLRPEMIHGLSDWEKSLAEQALDLSRSLRHDLEGITDIKTLEGVSAKTQTQRQEIGKTWFKERFIRMTPEQQKIVEAKLRKKLNLDQAKQVAAATAAKEVEARWNSPETK